MIHRLRSLLGGLIVAGAVAMAASAHAATVDAEAAALAGYKKSLEQRLPDAVESSIDHLLQVTADRSKSVDPERLKALLAFVADHTVDTKTLDMQKRLSSSGACTTYQVPSSLDRVLHYYFNPAIPAQLLMPGLVQQADWLPGSDILTLSPPLWERLDGLSANPLVLRGFERETCAPGESNGVWYTYDMHRLLVLLPFRGAPAFISVTLQTDDSTVGHKAVMVDKKDWLFFYSGISGINRSTFSWVDTYIYRSATLQVFLDLPGRNATDAVQFKWLDAGWKGINAVGRSHIIPGQEEYVRSMQRVVGDWPAPEALERIAAWAKSLSGAELDRLTADYAKAFEARAEKSPVMTDDSDFMDEVRNGGYAKVLDASARRAVLSVEALKCLLGRQALGDICAAEARLEEPGGQGASTLSGVSSASGQ